jgi:hypothetical protein
MTPPRLLLAVAATVAVAVVAVVAWAAAPSAGASDGCAGNLIFSKPIKDGKNRKVGELDVYWNPATERNCAITLHAGRTWGKELDTGVRLSRCAKSVKAGDYCETDPDEDKPWVKDDGAFLYQAGPVSLKAAGRCIFAEGDMYLQGHWRSESTTPDHTGRFCK